MIAHVAGVPVEEHVIVPAHVGVVPVEEIVPALTGSRHCLWREEMWERADDRWAMPGTQGSAFLPALGLSKEPQNE